jgi:hypothetical protein
MNDVTFLQIQVVQLRELLAEAGDDPILVPQLQQRLAEAEQQLSSAKPSGDPSKTYHGRIQNGTVILDDRVELPDGTEVRVEPVTPTVRRTLAEQFGNLIGSVPDLPPDMAEHHDHYIHGTLKS